MVSTINRLAVAVTTRTRNTTVAAMEINIAAALVTIQAAAQSISTAAVAAHPNIVALAQRIHRNIPRAARVNTTAPAAAQSTRAPASPTPLPIHPASHQVLTNTAPVILPLSTIPAPAGTGRARSINVAVPVGIRSTIAAPASTVVAMDPVIRSITRAAVGTRSVTVAVGRRSMAVVVAVISTAPQISSSKKRLRLRSKQLNPREVMNTTSK